ncbi:MAG: carboxylesterase family protein, partial [Pseudomonadota bacterium]
MTQTRPHIALLALGLAACSDGGDSSSPPPPPAPKNSAPSFSTAPVDVSVEENTTATLATIEASDPDGDTLAFSVTDDDASTFAFDAATGALGFTAAPDFEAPGDANGDNVYVATLQASDPGGLSATLAISVTVTDVAENGDPVRYRDRVFTQLQVEDGVTFATVEGQGLRLTIYTPEGDAATDRPVMIAASGGGFQEQDRESVEPIAQEFARRGYVGVTMDYRVLGQAPLDADELAIAGATATQDMFAAVRFLRAEGEGANPRGIRPDAIFVSGESAGGVMAMLAATLDPDDPISRPALADFLDANGGVYGAVGDNDDVSSLVQGAMPLSGGVLDLATIDASSALIYAAHEEFDPVVPCDTAPEGVSFTGLEVSGACDVVPAYGAAGATAELFLVENSTGHVEFTDIQRRGIYQGAAELFFESVISPT